MPCMRKRNLSNPIWGIGIDTHYEYQKEGNKGFIFPKYNSKEKKNEKAMLFNPNANRIEQYCRGRNLLRRY